MSDMMVDLQSIKLEMEYQILTDGKPITDKDWPIVGAANLLHSCFSNVECNVAEMRITKPHHLYGYQVSFKFLVFITRSNLFIILFIFKYILNTFSMYLYI